MWNSEITYEIEGENGTRITCTTLATLEKIVERTKKDFEEKDATPETIMLPFEFIIGSLFPSSYNSIKDMMTKQYIEGYQAGFEEGLKSEEEGWEGAK